MSKPEFISFLYSNTFVLAFTFLICLLLLDFVKRKKSRRFPPGPRGVPFLGNILQVDFRHPTVFFTQAKQKFGDIFSVQFFWQKIVVINGFEAMKEALINRSEDIADRPRFPLFEKLGFTENTKGSRDTTDTVRIGTGKISRNLCFSISSTQCDPGSTLSISRFGAVKITVETSGKQ
ncbi:PREDICTED: cytochrome P450 2D15-like [Nanorana parkeri]|uniref:cytochrome P450 2D15-like n=1 Tax=Nanorana parkeri TaxID=125878 RepID=UPI000854026F|nr:PREDICTED: cytochrome P450 2D15-like [Nanorana parkeri]